MGVRNSRTSSGARVGPWRAVYVSIANVFAYDNLR